MKQIPILAAYAAIFFAPVSAIAQDTSVSPVGDWHGEMTVGSQTMRSVLDIQESAPGVFAGTTGSPETGRWNVRLENVTFEDDMLAFDYPGGAIRFEGTWDETTSAWVGEFRLPNGSGEVVYKRGLLGLPVIDGLDGRWEGSLNIQGANLRLVFRIDTNEHGTTGLMDSPDQLATDIPVSAISRDGDTVTFELAAAGARYQGTLSTDGTSIEGAWYQGGGDFALNLVRGQATVGQRTRPQTPEPPFPYTVEEVSFENPAAPGVRLACTLTTPGSGGPHPTAYLITGSGVQDRDETLLDHKPFLVVADHLSRYGTAVLRCDDRGAGESVGEFNNAALEDFASDVEAALDYLRARRDIDPERIGLIGHSEGGMIGSMVASGRPDVAFVVMLAGPGVAGVELLIEQGSAVTQAMGVSAELDEQGRVMRRAMFDAALAAPNPEAAQAAVEEVLMASGQEAGITREIAQAQAAQAASPGILRILQYDPVAFVPNLAVPVLAIIGSKDTQVPPSQNLPALRELLTHNEDATVLEMQGLNHLFQTAETGAPGEYADIEETFAPIALKTISDWLAERGFGDVSP